MRFSRTRLTDVLHDQSRIPASLAVDCSPDSLRLPAAANPPAIRQADPAQPTAAPRTGSYALASDLHQHRSKQKIIGDL
jgi:hypothetical protein